jgi:hypothetical protein
MNLWACAVIWVREFECGEDAFEGHTPWVRNKTSPFRCRSMLPGRSISKNRELPVPINLPDSLQGMQSDFFWAIGAPSPFPFIPDVTRKNVRVIHVVYGAVGPGSNKKSDFMAIFRTVHVPRRN